MGSWLHQDLDIFLVLRELASSYSSGLTLDLIILKRAPALITLEVSQSRLLRSKTLPTQAPQTFCPAVARFEMQNSSQAFYLDQIFQILFRNRMLEFYVYLRAAYYKVRYLLMYQAVGMLVGASIVWRQKRGIWPKFLLFIRDISAPQIEETKEEKSLI